MIEFINISKTFAGKDGPIKAIENISLTIEQNEIFGIIGASGAGKSTLLRFVNALESPDAGEVIVDGIKVHSLNKHKLRELKKNIGMIFQQFNLLGNKTVEENILLPLELHDYDNPLDIDRILDFVGLTDKKNSYPRELSGGQKQRVGIARGLITRPKILLCDEPTSALDEHTKREIIALLARASKEFNVTTLIVTHELDVVKKLCERVAILDEVIEEPYTIELEEVTDNVQYNDVVQHKEAYASFAQHEPFMEQYNEANEGNLVSLQTIYDPIVGFYSPVYDSIEDIEEGAEVAIPSDKSNETRALLTLAEHDFIEIDESVEPIDVTLDDITDNPYNFEFTSIDLLNLTAAYEDGVELVFNLPTYIANIGLTPDDALFLESAENTLFALTVVVHEDNADNEATEALINAFTSQEVYDYLTELSDVNHLIPAFADPSAE